MPIHRPTNTSYPYVIQALEHAAEAVEQARRVRRTHRRKRRPDRDTAIRAAMKELTRCRRLMRSLVHSSVYGPFEGDVECRRLSRELQAEHRKLWKMSRV